MLHQLPVEVISTIISYLPSAHDVASLAATTPRLHRLVEEGHEGWRVFVLSRFPSIPHPLSWKDAAHALSSLSRNLDRRAFIASELRPKDVLFVTQGVTQDRYTKPSAQTMGYQAVLDSYDHWTSSNPADRKEVVAWGAGADLIMRRSTKATTPPSSSASSKGKTGTRSDTGPKRRSEWWVYQEQVYREGLHDITSVNLLQPQYLDPSHDAEELLVGRASGDLDLIQVHAGGRQVLRNYHTDGAVIRATDLSSPGANLLVACTGNHGLSLYPLHGEDEPETRPTSSIFCSPETEISCRSWSTKFMSDDKVAVGRGPSKYLVHVYAVAADGLRKEPIRMFGSGSSQVRMSSAYPLANLPRSSADTEADGQCLFSGGFDGRIRLHDLRSPSDCELTITDPIDRTSVFSLATVGRERIIAGSSMNSLVKVFDLRMTGGRAYSYVDLPSAMEPSANHWVQSGADAASPSGFNVFTGVRNSPRGGGRSARSHNSEHHSPVYSLSRPSPASPLLYIGRENNVSALNFTSLYDAHPDPMFGDVVRRTGPRQTFNHKATWWPEPRANLCLTFYEHHGSRSMRILSQVSPYHASPGKTPELPNTPLPGYDERVRDLYGDSDEQPQPQPQQPRSIPSRPAPRHARHR